MKIYKNILETIGKTPLVQLNKLTQGANATVVAKLEARNPGGSVKDRICISMVEEAEKQGIIKPGATLIEPTSGNTGIGLAMVAAVKGYKLILTMPETMSIERRNLLKAYGAQLVLTPDLKAWAEQSKKLKNSSQTTPNSFMPQQFKNLSQPQSTQRNHGTRNLGRHRRQSRHRSRRCRHWRNRNRHRPIHQTSKARVSNSSS